MTSPTELAWVFKMLRVWNGEDESFHFEALRNIAISDLKRGLR